MSAEDEEQDIIDQKIDDADWCNECGTPIGVGRCGGCIAVSSYDAQFGDGCNEDDEQP